MDWYAYGARWYEAGIGRFTGVDPISDRFPWVSTYNYAENRPSSAIDLHGLQAVDVVQNGMYEQYLKGQATKQDLHGMWSAQFKGGVAGAGGAGLGGLIRRAVAWAISNPATVVGAVRNIGYTLFEAVTEQQMLGFGAGFLAGGKVTSRAIAKFSSAEKSIILEAAEILESKQLSEAIEAGVEAKVMIDKYTIHFHPGLSFSGFTGFGDNSFIIGDDVLLDGTGNELAKTVLHELWRLNNSLYKGGKIVTKEDILNAGYSSMQDVFRAETEAAQKFGDDVYDAIVNQK